MPVEFDTLLKALASGQCTRDIWEYGAINHYTSYAIEDARIRLVRAAIELPVWEWPSVPSKLVDTAITIRNSLR